MMEGRRNLGEIRAVKKEDDGRKEVLRRDVGGKTEEDEGKDGLRRDARGKDRGG